MVKNNETKKISPLKAIKLKCLDCSCGVRKEVDNCAVIECPLYPFRKGHKPKDNSKKNE